MSELKAFQQQQLAFIDSIKHPDGIQPQGVEARRMKVYQELFFNNILGFVSSAYPVLKSLFDESEWLTLVRAFFCDHDCESPYFRDIAHEFLDFLSSSEEHQRTDMPFMLELAHYEWTELAMATAHEDPQHQAIAQVQEITSAPLVVAETAWPLSYRFAVQHISANALPEAAPDEPTYLVVFRQADHQVSFLQVNGITALLLQVIEGAKGIGFDQVIASLADQLPDMPKNQLEQGALSLLQDLSHKGIVKRLKSR